jgi:hypothetical protein
MDLSLTNAVIGGRGRIPISQSGTCLIAEWSRLHPGILAMMAHGQLAEASAILLPGVSCLRERSDTIGHMTETVRSWILLHHRRMADDRP